MRLWSKAAVLAALALAVPASAQQTKVSIPACTATKPTPQDSDAAHSAYLLGKRFFDEADYGSAIHNFVDAYKLDCTKPELLLNIARASELLGNRAGAVDALETFMQRDQNLSADDRAQYQRRIDNLKAVIAAQAATAAPAPTPPPTVSAPPPPSASEPAPPPPPRPVEVRQHSAGPWIVVGIGGAAMIAGGVLLGVGASDVSSANSLCPGGTCSGTNRAQNRSTANSDSSTGTGLENAGVGILIGGVALAAAGLIWHFVEPTGPKDSKVSVLPVISPGTTGLAAVGTF